MKHKILGSMSNRVGKCKMFFIRQNSPDEMDKKLFCYLSLKTMLTIQKSNLHYPLKTTEPENCGDRN